MNADFPARVNLPQEVAQMIKKLIINKEFEPGDQLPSELELSSKLNLSRSTVREAMKILATQNIVEIKRGRGTFVANRPGIISDPLGVSFMNEKNILYNLFETRLIFEPNIAYLAAERATQQNIEKLETIMHDYYKAKGKGINHSKLDIMFHNAIAESTQNDVVDKILPIVNDSIIRGYVKTVNVPGSFEKSVVKHENILQAIKNKNSKLARIQMEKHLKEVMSEIF